MAARKIDPAVRLSILRNVRRVGGGLESLIAATPTGEVRNKLTEVNIAFMELESELLAIGRGEKRS